jgi:hypothetical protein
MQGGYTKFMLEQIRNSQEDDQTDRNRQVNNTASIQKLQCTHVQITPIYAL